MCVKTLPGQKKCSEHNSEPEGCVREYPKGFLMTTESTFGRKIGSIISQLDRNWPEETARFTMLTQSEYSLCEDLESSEVTLQELHEDMRLTYAMISQQGNTSFPSHASQDLKGPRFV